MSGMSVTRFDPTPSEPYGKCFCGEVVDTREAMSAHFEKTGGGGKHKVRVTNPSRPERIEEAIQLIVNDKLYETVNDIEALLDVGATEDEISEALRMVDSDISEFWKERDD